MSAYFDSGFCVRRPSWHGEEVLLEDYPDNWDDARRAAGLLWEPTEELVWRRVLITAGAEVPEGAVLAEPHADGGGFWFVQVPQFKIIARDDNDAVLDIGNVDRGLIRHATMGELLTSYSEGMQKAGAKVLFETTGSVNGGRQVYALVRLDEPYQIPGDPSLTYPFAALLNSHDGTTACKLIPTEVRVVCWNTFQMALTRSGNSGLTLRHSKHVNDRIEDAKVALATIREDAKAWQTEATDLAGIKVSDVVVRTFLDEFIPIPENAAARTRDARAERQGMFLTLYNESVTLDGIRGTAYGLVQATGEFLDHLRPFRSRDTYLARTMLYSEPVKVGAIKLIRELALAG